jgi:threonine aldolase
MDGARLANACAAAGCMMREMTVDAGVDILSFGGTKNGMMTGEAVIAFRSEIARDMRFLRKQSAQLASKMRYLAAQWLPYLEDNSASNENSGERSDNASGKSTGQPLWLANALHANKMATRLAEVLALIPEAHFTQPIESNQIFCTLPPETLSLLREKYFFYMWNEPIGEARFVTSWDTSDNDIETFKSYLISSFKLF